MGCFHFREGELRNLEQIMHFSASRAYMMMIAELISSASYICALYGVTDDLLTIHGEKEIPEVAKTPVNRFSRLGPLHGAAPPVREQPRNGVVIT